MKFALMPLHQATGHGQSFTWIFSVLLPTGETGFGAVLRTMGTNPSFTFGTLLVEEKFVYVLMILGPLLFGLLLLWPDLVSLAARLPGPLSIDLPALPLPPVQQPRDTAVVPFASPGRWKPCTIAIRLRPIWS